MYRARESTHDLKACPESATNVFIGPQGSECVPASKYKDGVFIASPQNITKELIAKVKADVPGRSVKQHHLGSC